MNTEDVKNTMIAWLTLERYSAHVGNHEGEEYLDDLFTEALDAVNAPDDASDNKALYASFEAHIERLREQLAHQCLDCSHVSATGSQCCERCGMVIGYTRDMYHYA
jgi:hypothetical protein